MAKQNDPQVVAMARRGYEKWLREVRTRDEASAVRRYASEVTRHDTQRFFGLDQAELIEALSRPATR